MKKREKVAARARTDAVRARVGAWNRKQILANFEGLRISPAAHFSAHPTRSGTGSMHLHPHHHLSCGVLKDNRDRVFVPHLAAKLFELDRGLGNSHRARSRQRGLDHAGNHVGDLPGRIECVRFDHRSPPAASTLPPWLVGQSLVHSDFDTAIPRAGKADNSQRHAPIRDRIDRHTARDRVSWRASAPRTGDSP